MNMNTTPTAGATRAADFTGRYYTGPSGQWYHVSQEWKHQVKLVAHGIGPCGNVTMNKRHLTSGEWHEHKLPNSIKIGDRMYCNGEPCEITNFYDLGGVKFLGVTARWGFEEGHTHENMIPFGSAATLLCEGLRLPFAGEEEQRAYEHSRVKFTKAAAPTQPEESKSN